MASGQRRGDTQSVRWEGGGEAGDRSRERPTDTGGEDGENQPPMGEDGRRCFARRDTAGQRVHGILSSSFIFFRRRLILVAVEVVEEVRRTGAYAATCGAHVVPGEKLKMIKEYVLPAADRSRLRCKGKKVGTEGEAVDRSRERPTDTGGEAVDRSLQRSTDTGKKRQATDGGRWKRIFCRAVTRRGKEGKG